MGRSIVEATKKKNISSLQTAENLCPRTKVKSSRCSKLEDFQRLLNNYCDVSFNEAIDGVNGKLSK